MAGLLDIFGGGAGSADDPYADILTPAQRNQMQVQGLLAMAGAFAQAGMPSRLPVPFGSALGSAAAALGTGQEAGMKTAIENALAAQKVRDLRNTAAFRQKLLGDIDPTSPLGRAITQITNPGGTAPAPGAAPAGATPSAGTYATPGASPAAPAAGGPLTMELPYAPGAGGGLLGSDGGAEGEYGAGQKVGGLLGPGPAASAAPAAPAASQAALSQDAAAAEVARLDADYAAKNPQASPAAKASMHVENVIAANRLPTGRGGSSTAPAEPDPGAGGDTPWGPTFAQQAASRTGPARGETPEMTQLIERAAAERGISPDVLRGLIKTKSGFKPNIVSPAGAVGLAQLMPGTARELGVTDPTDPTQAIPAAAQYLRQGLDAQGGDINRALMYYHGGPNTAMWGPKTQAYPGAVLAAAGGAPSASGGGGEDAGWGPTFAQGGPDRVIPSGAGGNPAATLAQYAPPAAGSVLTPPAGGGLLAPPPAGNQAAVNTLLLELARRNAASEVLGLGNPYNSLLGVLQGSPGYKGQIKGAEEAASEPYRQIARDQELKNALIKEGWQLDAKGNAVPVPLYNDVAAARANAISIAQEGPKLDSALAQQNRMRVTDAQGHVMIVPIPGGAETEAAGKGLVASAEAAAKAPYETKDVRVIGPDGQPATETMTVAEFNRRQALRAKNAAMGAAPQPGDIISAPAFTAAEEAAGKGSAEDIFKARTVAQDAAQSIETTKEARKLLDSGIFAGAGSDKVTALAKIGNALHLTGTNTRETVANTEAYFATVAGNVGRMIKQFGSGTGLSDADREYAAKMAAGQQTLDEASMRKILDINDRAGFAVINRHNTSVSEVRPGVSLTPLTVTPPTPYQRGIDKATYDSLPSGSPFTAPDGSQRIKP